MSDVILYAALKENARLTKEYIDSKGTGVSITYYQTPQSPGYPYASTSAVTPTCPQVVQDWSRLLNPLVTIDPNGFKVCNGDGQFRCNACCLWTVPAGATRAQFQLWGPGGGTSNNCCCGGAPFGPSGAYVVVQMDVVPGQSYTLCSGCAVCCCASQTTPGGQGSPTFVTGTGLCVCAEGGNPCYCCWNRDINSGTCGCAIPAVGQGGADFCAAHGCSGWNFCWDTGGDDTTVCHAFSYVTWNVSCAGTGRNLLCYGMNGLWPYMKIGPNLNSGTLSVSTPVFGFESCVRQESWDSGGTCHGHCRHASQGFLQIPGAGGYASRVFGGCNACGGDYGRMGMVCVSWR
jgi:hypothetical protein